MFKFVIPFLTYLEFVCYKHYTIHKYNLFLNTFIKAISRSYSVVKVFNVVNVLLKF